MPRRPTKLALAHKQPPHPRASAPMADIRSLLKRNAFKPGRDPLAHAISIISGAPPRKLGISHLDLLYVTTTGGRGAASAHPGRRKRECASKPRCLDRFTNLQDTSKMADANVTNPSVAAELKKKRTFHTFSYCGIVLEKLLDLSNEDFVEAGDISLVHARARCQFQLDSKRRPMGFIKKLRKEKKEAPPNSASSRARTGT
ncbi:hypothetical protein B0H10DRAFT_2219376 [Mycena sp. CBHHK59/15]|nr:hypothetical protein B0H10DRAFT_2245695 [Mycena sp. CBHHK59/15]KAJ6616554.1 hypothetical protein B0H10DRAFT_2219376 [Mycena sp. CBHHK59/15]